MTDITCDICGYYEKFERSNYGPWTCPECGQRYDWDETLMIILTPEQLELLRSQKGWNKEIKLPPNPMTPRVYTPSDVFDKI